MSDSGTFLCGSCLCFVAIPAVILIALSFATLEPVEYGLNFNAITMSLENTTYSVAGLYFLGFGHWFIKFPRIIQTIEFMANSENQLLHTRTSDGLPLTLGLSFQYRYMPEHLYTLYLTYKGEHHAVYVNTATATIANVACNYSAYTFFNDKQGIATEMQYWVTRVFDEELFAFVEALQIMRVELPAQFQNAILQSIEAKQNITQAQRYMANMQVTFQTELLIANQTRLQTVAMARGTASQRRQAAEANARVTEQSVYAEMYAYGNLSQTVDLNTTEMMSYIWWSGQEDIVTKGKEFLVGLDPSAVIRNRGAGTS